LGEIWSVEGNGCAIVAAAAQLARARDVEKISYMTWAARSDLLVPCGDAEDDGEEGAAGHDCPSGWSLQEREEPRSANRHDPV
jgi:hypothetical protein